jgi:hypothetical protein
MSMAPLSGSSAELSSSGPAATHADAAQVLQDLGGILLIPEGK